VLRVGKLETRSAHEFVPCFEFATIDSTVGTRGAYAAYSCVAEVLGVGVPDYVAGFVGWLYQLLDRGLHAELIADFHDFSQDDGMVVGTHGRTLLHEEEIQLVDVELLAERPLEGGGFGGNFVVVNHDLVVFVLLAAGVLLETGNEFSVFAFFGLGGQLAGFSLLRFVRLLCFLRFRLLHLLRLGLLLRGSRPRRPRRTRTPSAPSSSLKVLEVLKSDSLDTLSRPAV
jgi:hypothetical protein